MKYIAWFLLFLNVSPLVFSYAFLAYLMIEASKTRGYTENV